MRLLLAFIVLVLVVLSMGQEADSVNTETTEVAVVDDGFVGEIYVCEATEHAFLGSFTASKASNDGAPVYNNANDMSFFRNRGFWYIGNLEPWPPATHYRCVEYEGCNYNANYPPATTTGKWAAAKLGKTPVPVVQYTPCSSQNDEL